jgi:hypothetical protein
MAHFTFHNSQCQWVTLNIFDPGGRKVASVQEGRRLPGDITLKVDLSALEPGIYIYQLTTGEQMISGKLAMFQK